MSGISGVCALADVIIVSRMARTKQTDRDFMMDYLVELRRWEVPMICCITRKDARARVRKYRRPQHHARQLKIHYFGKILPKKIS
jgi:hypothetical protein